METTREIALRTYNEAVAIGMQDAPMNWHIWKRAFDIAEIELKKLRVADVISRRELLLDFAEYSESDNTSTALDECVDNYLDSIKQ